MSNLQNNLVLFLWKKRKSIISWTIVGAILSVIVSLFITPRYLSTAILYPTATSTVSFSDARNALASSMDFGEDEQAEQMLQVLQSSRLSNRIIQQFDLMKHYGIKPDEKNAQYKMGKKYNKYITCSRTRYGSIQISVLDTDPQIAADITNKIVDLYDTVMNEMVRERTIPAFEVNARKMKIIEDNIAVIGAKLDSLSKLGVVPDKARTNLYDAYNNSRGEDRVFFKHQLDVNIRYGSEYDGLVAQRDEMMTNMSIFEAAYEQAESDANANLNHKFVVEGAFKADKKETPQRSLIVLLATVGTFVFSIFFFLVKDKIEELKKIA